MRSERPIADRRAAEQNTCMGPAFPTGCCQCVRMGPQISPEEHCRIARMGPELLPELSPGGATDYHEWAQKCPWVALPMVLNGPGNAPATLGVATDSLNRAQQRT